MNGATFWLAMILGAPLLAAVVLILLTIRKPSNSASSNRQALWAGPIALVGTLVSLVSIFMLLPRLYAGESPALSLAWMPTAGIALRLRMDWVALPFAVTEAAVTLIAVFYALGYHRTDERSPFFYALLMLFQVGMSGTTLADDTFLFYVFWELMLIASCLLIVVWGDGERRNAVAFKYFVFTHLGSLLVLVGLILLYDASGTASLSALRNGVTLEPGMVSAVIALFVVGFSVKMAVFPLHLWLPDAHTVAPMPVTIMLAAAMLSMGVFGILRFPMSFFGLEAMRPFGVPMMVVGVISEVYGAMMALAERDVKRIIAYSSVSQMGYILLGLGTMTHQGVMGATLHVVYHGIVKALLFMCAGLIIRATGKRRIDEIGGLAKSMPVTAACMAVGALTIAGAPPFCVFDSEWMIFAGAFATDHLWLALVTLFGSLLTVVYALWLFGRLFLGAPPEGQEVARVPWQMLWPTVFLAALALIEGLFPAPLFDWVSRELPLLLGGGW